MITFNAVSLNSLYGKNNRLHALNQEFGSNPNFFLAYGSSMEFF